MASSSNPIAASATTTSNYYDVFLNHRGTDVKETLATHLYQRLTVDAGLRVFLDKEALQEGDNIPSHLKGAIRSASVHIAIFSTNYAESNWCLNELLLMLESGKTIIPIFYGVKPSELRWTLGAKGVYGRALQILEEQKTIDSQTLLEKPRYEPNTIAEWREALSRVADIKGFEVACNSYDMQFLEKVVKRVLEKLPKTPLNVCKYPTGLADKVQDFIGTVLTPRQTGETIVVGIVGLGGVGKTTLAKEFFNRERSKYDRSSFLPEVREKAASRSLHSLQSLLLEDLTGSKVQINSTDEGISELRQRVSSCQAQALIILDDVDGIDQLNVLLLPVKDALRSSSIILVTSRKKDVLKSFGIVEISIYKLEGLNRHHSRELFCSHAFHQPYPVKGFEQLVEDFLDACHGLPLSLQVIGALLHAEDDLNLWKAQLRKISKILPEDIQRTLKISYDSLDREEKNIFLDIACYFIGADSDTTIRIWDGSRWEGSLGLRKLEDRCLVEVDSKNRIRMHDHLRDLGRDLAENEPPGYELRLWHPIDNFLHNLSSQSLVRGISGNGAKQFFENLAGSCNLSRLQLLRAEGYFVERVLSVGELPRLIYLSWMYCPMNYLPSSIPIKNLRVLHIQEGDLKTLWQHESQAPLELRELFIVASLSMVPESIGKLKHLEKFVLHSSLLETLPDSLGNLTNLRTLDLGGCSTLQTLPHSVGGLTNLRTLDLGGCSTLQTLPHSAGGLINLRTLDLGQCATLRTLPESFGGLRNLRTLDLAKCSALQRLPDSVGGLTNLQTLDLSGCSTLRTLPDSVGDLTSLQKLGLDRCSTLRTLPDSVGGLTNLQTLDLGGPSTLRTLPDSVGGFCNLQTLDLRECSTLQKLPDSIGSLRNLQTLDLRGCSTLQKLPDSIGSLRNLQTLDLSGCSTLQTLPDSVGALSNLQTLALGMCTSLQTLPDSFGGLTNLQTLRLSGCPTLQTLLDSVGGLTYLQTLDLSEWWMEMLLGRYSFDQLLASLVRGSMANLTLPDSIGCLTNLQTLDLSWCTTLHTLPNSLGSLTKLKCLYLWQCSALQMLPDSVGRLTNLQTLDLRECSNLRKLPLSLRECSKLQIRPEADPRCAELRWGAGVIEQLRRQLGI